MALKKFGLARMNNSELLAYCREVRRLKDDALSDDNELRICLRFVDALSAFESAQALDQTKFGERLAALDASVDKIWMNIHTILGIHVDHYDPEVTRAAKVVDGVFHKISNPTKLPYQDEYSALESLFDRMDELNPEVLEKSGVAGWYHVLKGRADEFNALRIEQTQSKRNVEVGAIKSARNELVEAHRELIDKVNAYLMFFPSEAMENFATDFQNLNDRMRIEEKTEGTLKEKEKAVTSTSEE